MKALIAISFALEIDSEDDLMRIAQSLDEGMLNSITAHLAQQGDQWGDLVSMAEDANILDWYGATVSLKRPVLEHIEGSE